MKISTQLGYAGGFEHTIREVKELEKAGPDTAWVAEAYGCEVMAVLPHSDQLMSLASEGVFSLRHPDHPLTAEYRRISRELVALDRAV